MGTKRSFVLAVISFCFLTAISPGKAHAGPEEWHPVFE